MQAKHARPSPAAVAVRKAGPALAVAGRAAPAALAAAGMALTSQGPALAATASPAPLRLPAYPGVGTGTQARAPSVLALHALRAAAVGPPAKSATHSFVYTVQPGDCLWSIAAKFYHDGDYMRIYDANRRIIANPALVKAGQQIVIPGISSTAAATPAPASSPPVGPVLTSSPLPPPGADDITSGGTWSIFDQIGGQRQAVAFAIALLKAIDAPVNIGNVQVIYDWEVSEGSGGMFNPLNGGNWGNLAISGPQFGGGACDYADLDTNVRAMAGLLLDPLNDVEYGYGAIVAALQHSNPQAARTAIWNSSWAASHYGWGASFSDAPVPG